jgi:hypothetical protein
MEIMTPAFEPPPPGPAATVAGGRVRLRTLILIRWVAILGQLTALLVVHFGLGYPVPLLETLAAVAVSVIVNVWATRRPRSTSPTTCFSWACCSTSPADCTTPSPC